MKKLARIALVGSLSCFMVLPVLADLNNGLVAYYPFNGNANDESDNGNDGTVNGATLAEDRFGKADSAYSFDGDDHISTPLLRSPLSNLTITVWFKYNSSVEAGYNAVIGVYNDGPSTNFFSPSTSFFIGKNSGNSSIGVQDGNYVPNVAMGTEAWDRSWHHIVYTYTGSIGNIYLDGDFVGSASLSGGTGTILIGLEAELNGYYFNGIIDDIRIYNRVLSEDEIKEIYEKIPSNSDCKHATYSLKKRTLTVPFIEIPVIDFLTGQSNGKVELWSSNLRQVSGTTNRFRIISKTLAPITDGSSTSCPATYAIETGTLSIPYVDIPVGIGIGNKKSETDVDVFKATMTWVPMGRSFVIQEIEQLDD